jgi:hypothetical protein
MSLAALAFLVVIGPQQYGSINLLYAPGGPVEVGSQNVPPSECEVLVQVFNKTGKQVASETLNLALGQSGELTFGSGGGVFTQQVTVENNCPSNSPNCDSGLCNINETVETVNSITGDTQVLNAEANRPSLVGQQ